MDPNHKLSVDEQQVEESNEKKCCTGCHTSKTPLWRGGPAGPKSLCNACGIKYHKKRRQQISTFEKPERKTLKPIKRNRDMKLKMRFMVVNKKPPHNVDDLELDHDHDNDLHQPRQPRKRSSYERGKPWWNKLREEEQAAILLMAISCGGSMYS